MNVVPTSIPGAFIVELEPVEDERGFFARTYSEDEFCAHGLQLRIAECSLSFNPLKGTLRGMHYQSEPHAETKLVRCGRGAIFDVILDLRADSPAFTRWSAHELTPTNGRMLYVPDGVAHGFQTLADDTEVTYQISERHVPHAAAGVRWNDDAFGIDWPLAVAVISSRDRDYPDFAVPAAVDA